MLKKYRLVCKIYAVHHGNCYCKLFLYTRAFYYQSFNFIAYLDQELLNGTMLDILVCKIHEGHVMITIMVPINFFYEVLLVLKVSSLYHLWLVRSSVANYFVRV